MKIQVILEDKQENYREIINVDECLDKNNFSYVDSDGANVDVNVLEDGLIINRKAKTHQLYLVLRDNGYAQIKTIEGELKFLIKVLDLNINNDNISIDYCLNDSQKTIKIIYLGD